MLRDTTSGLEREIALMLTDPSGTLPAYLRLGGDALASRARRAVATLGDCRACPRDCGVNRLEDRWAACKTGRYAVVSSFFPHFGEEDCLRGWNGSGTIFFGHCNLRCVFCQNFDISQDIKPAAERGSTPREIADMIPEARSDHGTSTGSRSWRSTGAPGAWCGSGPPAKSVHARRR